MAMSYGWDAKWIRKKIKMSEGLEIETCVDITTGLIVCPLCINISNLCPSYAEPESAALTSSASLFFTSSDLFHHMRAHAKSSEWKAYISGEEEEEEVGEEEIEEGSEET